MYKICYNEVSSPRNSCYIKSYLKSGAFDVQVGCCFNYLVEWCCKQNRFFIPSFFYIELNVWSMG
jgi:hypothetical protein